ncbi:MAG: hypothetical protein NW241_12570 [Bacteroidia bacterium]|nr:hypothetical protein [Bacteroidia bacterium]
MSFMKLILVAMFLFSVSLAIGQRKMDIDYEQYEAECMGVGNEGTQLIKVWSYALNANEAIQRAKKNAVHAALFRGFPAGQAGCATLPLIQDSEAAAKHKNFFDEFFTAEGSYLRYVSMSGDGAILPQDRIKVGRKYKIGVVVVVAHGELRRELEREKIIRGLSTGF